jgi:hypothetical protein
LEDFAESLMKKMTKAPRLTCSEAKPQQDEEAAFDAQAMERWFDDGGMWDQALDVGNLKDQSEEIGVQV